LNNSAKNEPIIRIVGVGLQRIFAHQKSYILAHLTWILHRRTTLWNAEVALFAVYNSYYNVKCVLLYRYNEISIHITAIFSVYYAQCSVNRLYNSFSSNWSVALTRAGWCVVCVVCRLSG